MPFENWPRRVKNIVFMTLKSSINQRQQKREVLKKDLKF